METKRSRFTEEQIIGILREQEGGLSTSDVCRKHGISSATFYKWKAKFGGLDVSDAKRLKSLEDENAKLKKLFGRGHARQCDVEGYRSKKCMVRPVRARHFDGQRRQLRKCIRPLASGLLLQPGHDEIRAYRSQIMVGTGHEFLPELTTR